MQHNFSFDPTYGYDEAALLAIAPPPAPADFSAFWRETYILAKVVPPRPSRRLVEESNGLKIFEVEFDAWSHSGPIRVGGWLTVPMGEAITQGMVVGHGYGGRNAPDPSPLVQNAAIIYPCARGFNRSAMPDIPGVADEHVLHGISAKETYVHRGCVVDLWAAAWALMELEQAASQCLTYAGASFGGGIGALAIPWEPAFRRAFLDYPSFGHHPLRLTMQCVGSGEAVRQHGGGQHLPVLRYFDAATAATHIKIPVLVGAALFDPAVPPPGQFAIYNSLQSEKQLAVRQAAHYSWAGESSEELRVNTLAQSWLKERARTAD